MSKRTMVNVSVQPDEKAKWQKVAEINNVTLSALVRGVMMVYCRQALEKYERENREWGE